MYRQYDIIVVIFKCRQFYPKGQTMKYSISTFKTKKLLSETLKALMKQKPFSKISICEITEKCNLNRKTFYYHFKDLDQLLKWTLENDAVSTIKEYSKSNNYTDAIKFAIDYVERNKKLFGNAGNTLGRDDLIYFLGGDLKEIFKNNITWHEQTLNIKLPDDYKNFLCSFYAEALAGQIVLLLKNDKQLDCSQDKDKIINYLSVTISSSIESSIKNSLGHL